jgi:ADP-ribose pyrophosphatase YjhB (NUDIX family)
MPVPEYIAAIRRTYGHAPLLLPGVSGVVVEGEGDSARLLLVRRSDNGLWSLPAGIVEPGEQPADTIIREVLEETCVRIRPERLVLLSVDPEITYPNGDRCQFVSMTFRCAYLGGIARVGDEESTAVEWFGLKELPKLSERQQRRLTAALAPAGPTEFYSSAPAV